MVYHHLYKKFAKTKHVNAGIVGAGAYGTAIVTQDPHTPLLSVVAIADVSVKAAKGAYAKAGIDPTDTLYCDTVENAQDAIENGKHVAMITKDCDVAVGPVLKKLANDTGVVYTPVDGDQHGLLIQFYEWAMSVGLSVIGGGKATDGEFVFDAVRGTVTIMTGKKIRPPSSRRSRLRRKTANGWA